MTTSIAHYIRNSSTKQFRAIRSIPAKLRWCLTGTPIQNSLEDLGALVKFLRVPVLEDLAVFRKQISTPVFSKSAVRFTNLRRLLEALCLRRTKVLLDLPEPNTVTRLLELSVTESSQYHDYAESCKHAIDVAVSGRSIRKANQHVIQAILGMRLFCNDGMKALMKRQEVQSIPLEHAQAGGYFQPFAEPICVVCEGDVTIMDQDDDESSGTLTICQHVVCRACLPSYEIDLDEALESGYSQCPVCKLRANRASFIVKPSASEVEMQGMSIADYPTKLRALLENVEAQIADGKR